MADRRLSFKKLRQILKRFDCWEDPSAGKGSHTMFYRQLDDGVYSYPIPTHKKEVDKCYVVGARRKFRLTDTDGVTDDDFYGD